MLHWDLRIVELTIDVMINRNVMRKQLGLPKVDSIYSREHKTQQHKLKLANSYVYK